MPACSERAPTPTAPLLAGKSLSGEIPEVELVAGSFSFPTLFLFTIFTSIIISMENVKLIYFFFHISY